MKIGDLLRIITPLPYTYEGDEVPWDKDGYLVPGKISIPCGTIVTVLGVARKSKCDIRENTYYKILTPGGVGWVWGNYVSVVEP